MRHFQRVGDSTKSSYMDEYWILYMKRNTNSFTWSYIRYHLFVSIRGLVEAASIIEYKTEFLITMM